MLFQYLEIFYKIFVFFVFWYFSNKLGNFQENAKRFFSSGSCYIYLYFWRVLEP